MKTDLTKTGRVLPIVTGHASPKDLFREMMDWTDRVARRAYELFQMRGFENGHDLDDWFAAEHEFLKPVALEVKDIMDEVIVRAEVPGFEAKDLEIEVEGTTLVIRGKRETSKEETEKESKTLFTACKAEQIYRAIELPTSVIVEKSKAELKNGVLELELPKAAKPKTIAVTAA